MNYKLEVQIELAGNWSTRKQTPEARKKDLERMVALIRSWADSEIRGEWWMDDFSITSAKADYNAYPSK